jgi:hypothetical protein
MHIEERSPSTWDAFLTEIKELKHDRLGGADLLFRGHANSTWGLQTTLERRGQPEMPVIDYYKLITTRVKSQVESSTGRSFDLPSDSALLKLFDDLKDYEKFSRENIPCYSFLIYTRHHGFPSPILDWTRSVYVAAFFAFADENTAQRRSVYVWPRPTMSVGGTNTVELRRLGPYITTHRRHVLQQCRYSICAQYSTDSAEWRFMPHESAVAGKAFEHLYKFNIPSTERKTVLAFLDDFNLNAYSLFGSEEGLMHTLAFRAFDLNEDRR